MPQVSSISLNTAAIYSLCQLAQARYQVTDNAKNMITAFDTFSLTASTVYSEDELKVVNDEIVETNSE